MTDSDPFPDEGSSQLAVTHPDDHGDDGTLEVYPPDRGTSMQAADFLDQHVAMLGKAWRIADVVCQTPAAPKAYRGKPKEGTVAILYGAEVGLPPMAALQKVINVNGNPGLEARTMKGLLKTKGFKFRTITKTADVFEIWAWEPGSPVVVDTRPTLAGDEPNPHYGKRINPDETSRWDMERARLAKFCPRDDPDKPGHFIMRTKQSGDAVVDGNMKYIEQPIEMLEAKGTADVCRSIAPEILLGLPYAAEERDDWADDDDDEPPPTTRRPAKRGGGVSRLRERAKTAAAQAADQAGYEEPQDAEVVTDPATEPAGVGDPTREPGTIPNPGDPETGGITTPDLGTPAESDNREKPIQADVTPETPGDGQVSEGADSSADAEVSQTDATARPPVTNPSPGPTVTREEGVTGEELPSPAVTRQRAGVKARPADEPAPDLPATPAGDDLEMSEQVRLQGEKMLTSLLTEGKITDASDQSAVVAEVLTKIPDAKVYRGLDKHTDVNNRELKAVVDVLRTQKAKSKLADYLGEGINAASLREAGMLETEEAGK